MKRLSNFRLVAIAGGCALLLFLAVSAGVWLLSQSAWFQDLVMTAVKSAVSSQLHGSIAWTSVRLTGLSSVTFDGLALTTDSGDTVIAVDRGKGRIALIPLLKRRIVITRLSLGASRVTCDRHIHPNLVDVFATKPDTDSKTPEPTWTFEIRRFSIDSLTARYRDTTGRTMTLVGGSHAGSLFVNAEFGLDVTGRAIDLAMPGHSLSVDTVHFSMRTNARRFLCDSFSVTAAQRMRVQGSFQLSYDPGGAIRADISCRANDAFFQGINARAWGIDKCDSVSVSAHVHGTLVRPVVNADAEVRAVRYRHQIGLDRLNAAFECDSLGAARCRLSIDDRALSGSCALSVMVKNLFSKPFLGGYHGSARIMVPDIRSLNHVLLTMKEPTVVTKGAATIDVTASGESFVRMPRLAHCTIGLTGTTFTSGKTLPAAFLRADEADDTITLDGGWPEVFSITARGSLVHDKGSGQGTFAIVNASPLTALLVDKEISGAAKGSFTLSRLFSSPLARVTISGPLLGWQGLVLSDFSSDVVYERKTGITINSASGLLKGGIERALTALGKPGIRGYVSASFSASGPALYPDATLDVTVDSLVSKVPLARLVKATVTLHDRTVLLDNFHCIQGKSVVDGTGSFDRVGKSFAMDLSVSSGLGGSAPGAISIRAPMAEGAIKNGVCTARNVPLNAALAWLPKATFPSGRLSLQASMNGTMSNPAATVAFQLSEISLIKTAVMPKLSGTAGIKDHSAVALCTLSISDSCGPLTLSARASLLSSLKLDTLAPIPLQIKIAGSNVCLKPYFLAFSKEIVVDGTLNADGAIVFSHGRKWIPQGTVTLAAKKVFVPAGNVSFENVTLDIQPRGSPVQAGIQPIGMSLHTGSVRWENVSFVRTSVQAAYVNNAVSIDTAELFLEKGKFLVAGTLPLAPFPAILTHKDFHLAVSADNIGTTTMNPFVSGGRFIAGTINGRLEFSSGQSADRNKGSLTADGMVFKVDDLQPVIGPLRSIVRIAGDSVLVNTTGPWGKGTINEQGVMTASGNSIGPSQVSVNCRDLTIDYLDDSRIRIDSLMAILSNPLGKWNLYGSVLFGESKVAYEVPFNKPVVSRRSTGAPKNPLALNINVILPNSFSTDLKVGNVFAGSASDVHASIAGSLLITGTLGSPRYAGQLQIDSGTATYLNNVFYIRQGYGRLTGANDINPFIDVVATTTLSQVQTNYGRDSILVTLHISGDLKNPAIVLSSNKGFSQIEIISLLTSGSTAFSLAGAGKTAPASIISNSLSSIASRQAQKTLGLEQVQIRGNLFAAGSSQSNASLSISKRISPDVTVTYSRGIADTIAQQGVISWKLKPFLFLEFESNDRGNAGIDLKYRIKK